MKRFHVHLRVNNLQASIAFYSRLFAVQPARVEDDYAKWMLEDPRINFAISTRGTATGLDHLGMQVDSTDELDALKTAALSADQSVIEQGETTCCYSHSEKHWVTDPDGNAWEHFHTLDTIPVFSQSQTAVASARISASACCAPVSTGVSGAGQAQPAWVAKSASLSGTNRIAITPVVSSCCGPSSGDKTC